MIVSELQPKRGRREQRSSGGRAALLNISTVREVGTQELMTVKELLQDGRSAGDSLGALPQPGLPRRFFRQEQAEERLPFELSCSDQITIQDEVVLGGNADLRHLLLTPGLTRKQRTVKVAYPLVTIPPTRW
jgi:hypothetical protein